MAPILEDLANIAKDTFVNLEHTHFSNSEAGQAAGALIKDQYLPTLHKIHSANIANEAKLPLMQQRHPNIIAQESREVARNAVFGQKDWVAAGLIKGVDKQAQHGWTPMQITSEKQRLADGMHMVLKDTQHTEYGDISTVKRNIKQNKAIGAVADDKFDASGIYRPPTEAESKVKNFAASRMIAGIAIPHIGTLFNYALNTPTQDLAKGMASMIGDYKNVHALAKDVGAFDGTMTDAFTVRWLGARGKIAQATNANFGAIVSQITHQPGFSVLREATIAYGAAAGKHTIERMAQEFVQKQGRDTFNAHQLRRFGIDPRAVLTNRGLTPDMLRAGIYRYIDTNAFLDTSLQRSFNANRNFFTRMGSMFHGYVARQGGLIRNSLIDMVQQSVGKDRSAKGAAMAAKTLGMLAIGFPSVGIGLKSLEMYGRGQFQEASPVEDYENLWGKNGPSKALVTALDGYAHMAALGIAADYYRGSVTHELASQVIGPIGNEITNLVQDTAVAVTKGNATPLGRDVLEDTLPMNLGKILAHQFLPTKKEESARHPKFGSGMKRSKSFSSGRHKSF